MAMRRMRRRSVRSRPYRSTLRSRTPYGRKRTFARRSVKDRFQATSDINRGGWNFRKKPKFNARRWKKQLWDASSAAQKYRSNNSVTFAVIDSNSAAVVAQKRVYFTARTRDAAGARFYQTAGGLVDIDGVSVTTTFGGGDLFIRGGQNTIQFANAAASPSAIKVETWLVRTTDNGGPPANPFDASLTWDPSLPDAALAPGDPNADVWKFYKFWGMSSTMLKPGEVFERTVPIRPQKIDQDQHINNRNRDFWCYTIQSMSAAGVNPLIITSAWNLSFTGDRTTV
uniref:Capsid protein n=1 Tax=Cressdnaviricota sp. TaxID=2748378 RepID=A0A6M3YPC3_9VIRU|nr:MAG: capsid protein [Cressdnaviricota sp.]